MGKWQHRIVERDIEALSGVCAICGPVRLKRKRDNYGGFRYLCSTSQLRWRGGNNPETRRSYRQRVRAPHRAHVGTSCERCGFVAVNRRQLDVHHRNGDHADNRVENLETVCANCHRLIHAA